MCVVKNIKNEKELIWAWMKWGFKRKMGISYWVFELWAGLEWTGGKWIKTRKRNGLCKKKGK